MDETPLSKDFEKLRMTRRNLPKEEPTENASGPLNDSTSGGSRRTRSQAASGWTVQDSLTLVNEICAIEQECADAFSSYQKWTMVAENCTAFDVVKTMNQCRRKWNSLLEEYKAIKGWERNSKGGSSYWSLDLPRKEEAGLPLEFDQELYTAVDTVVKIQGGRTQSDPDTDTEADFERPAIRETGSKKPHNRTTRIGNIQGKGNVFARKKGFKKPRRHTTPSKGITAEDKFVPIKNESLEMPWDQSPSFRVGIIKENEQLLTESENKSLMFGVEDRKHILTDQIQQNSELIHAIVTGNLSTDEDDEASDLRYEKSLEMKVARRQADKLISCLADLAYNLDHLRKFVEEG